MVGLAGIVCGRLMPRRSGMICTLLTALLLVATATSRGQAQNTADPGQGASDTGGPIVIPSARRAQQPVARSANGGPVVVPQVATPTANAPPTSIAAPANGAPAA